jgi:hypothetical protein
MTLFAQWRVARRKLFFHNSTYRQRTKDCQLLMKRIIFQLVKASDLSTVWLRVPLPCPVLSLKFMTLGFAIVLQTLPEGTSFC